MTSLVRRYLKTAVCFLAVGIGLGVWMLAQWIGQPWLRWGILAAGIAHGVGLLVFFLAMWSRMRPVGSQSREASGERF